MKKEEMDLQAVNRRLAEKWEKHDRFDHAEEHRRFLVSSAENKADRLEAVKDLIVNLNAQGKTDQALGWEATVRALYAGETADLAKSYGIIEIEWARHAALRGDSNSAVRHYQAAYETSRKFPRELAEFEGYVVSQLAGELWKAGRLFDAEPFLRQMVARTEKEKSCFPSHLDWVKMLTECLVAQANYWQVDGNRAKSRAAYEVAFEYAAKEAKERGLAHDQYGADPQGRAESKEFARALNVLANIHWQLGRRGAARLAFERAVKLELHELDALKGAHPHFVDSLKKYMNAGDLFENE